MLLKIWLKQGKEKRLLARILNFLEKARKRLSRQNSTIKVRKCEVKRPEFYKKHTSWTLTRHFATSEIKIFHSNAWVRRQSLHYALSHSIICKISNFHQNSFNPFLNDVNCTHFTNNILGIKLIQLLSFICTKCEGLVQQIWNLACGLHSACFTKKDYFFCGGSPSWGKYLPNIFTSKIIKEIFEADFEGASSTGPNILFTT